MARQVSCKSGELMEALWYLSEITGAAGGAAFTAVSVYPPGSMTPLSILYEQGGAEPQGSVRQVPAVAQSS